MTEEKKLRGFACLTPERRHEMSMRGAARAKETGKAHRWTRQSAQDASAKGLVIRRQHRDDKRRAARELTHV